jgi:hypothetical protein
MNSRSGEIVISGDDYE